MPTIVGVRLREAARPVHIDAGDLELAADDILLVATDRGEELGRVTAVADDDASVVVDAAARVVRVATREDLEQAEALHRKETEARTVFRRLIEKHKLDMKPADIEFSFDGTRATFYFVAEERVDFRELVRDLAAEFKVRVDMRQIGVRDEARVIGGLGHCGEQLCCVRFGGEFQPVSIRMAKEQDLPLNPLKISGLCGRLMCCLRYEYEAYKDFKGRAPKRGAIVEVGDGKGKVVDFNTPKETVTLRLEEGGTATVALADMECGSGAGCPCKVRKEALERRQQALTVAVGSVAAIRDTAAVPAPAPAPSDQASPAGSGERSRRRRRRSGAGGAADAPPAEQRQQSEQRAQAGGDAQKAQRAQGGQQRRGDRRGDKARPAEQQPKAAAPSEPSATPGRRRRRRRSGGGGATPAE